MISNPAIVYADRLCDSDTMTTKLIYRIRQNQLAPAELDRLQARCNRELSELRRELDDLLIELRADADRFASEAPSLPRKTAA
ncbi:hypothetical protein I8J29_30965 [Paenibacillus sp. MWE-103]|uniref:Uncharacterized protein n=1 Tax=Paenibacillus artemisiicola TaxID=1172618 RepID=A0ABS3WJX3_9BACL|nr:hypothetical protein [Paenibacillus artemisiicola]MBO7748607.1 hypothetical protein [Paenibacillus artemisiicola]